jgi:hypothetical protein
MAKDVADRVLGENEHVRVVCKDEYKNYNEREVSQFKLMPDPRGTFLMELVRAWGMVSGRRGTDTQQGRPTLELMSENEVVERAANMTYLTFAMMEKCGWRVALDRSPPIEAVSPEAKDDPAF